MYVHLKCQLVLHVASLISQWRGTSHDYIIRHNPCDIHTN
jgi:hypothetical protein